MQNHNDDTIKTSDTVFWKIYLSLYLKGLCVRGSWRPNRNCNILTPTLMAINVSFPFSWAAQPGTWGPASQCAGFSLPHLISNSLNFLCTELYNSSTSTFFLWASQIALIQPIHGQGYTLLFLDRMHQLFAQVHFLFWQLDRVVGQYTSK